MRWKDEWNKWRSHSKLPSELKKQINNMTEGKLEEASYKQLEFGTGGIRGDLVRDRTA